MTQEFENVDLGKTEDIFKCNIIQMIAMAKFALPHLSRGDSCVGNFLVQSSLPTNTSQNHQYVFGCHISRIGNYGGLLGD